MKTFKLLFAAAPLAFASLACAAPAHAEEADSAETRTDATATPATRHGDVVSTGVARARDRLDSATSTSTLTEDDIRHTGGRTVGEIFRNIPGMRSETNGSEGYSSISIRGLPIALGGAKFLQIQEDGMPTLEFGDIAFFTADNFLRADTNLAAIQAIRGGSASTFASNSPGGIINLISKTGTTEGGSLEASTGLDHDLNRIDFEYGAPLGDKVRFHVGGFYHQGEGTQKAGFDAVKGGQIKINLTREFDDGGYVRFYGKLLDDRTPAYGAVPIALTGTNGDPVYAPLAGFDARADTMLSRYVTSNLTLDENNRLSRGSVADGIHAKVLAGGLETQFSLGEWQVNEKFRVSDNAGGFITPMVLGNNLLPFPTIAPASVFAGMFGGPGASLSYATGPLKGQVIANPSTLNGNGLAAIVLMAQNNLDSANTMANDLRASRVWDFGGADLTLTAGFYKSVQDIKSSWLWTTMISDVAGGGNANLLNITTATGVAMTQDGYFAYGTPLIGYMRRNVYDLSYDVNAPYVSANYHAGKLSIGASLRYDYGKAAGAIYGSELTGGAGGVTAFDINGDGVISAAETRVSALPLSKPGLVNYTYDYLSYSVSANYRANDSVSLFGRYSRGGRANADRILFANYVNPADGSLLEDAAAYDPVQQAELGLKYRTPALELYVTGFWARTKEHNISLDRAYRAYGVEFEGTVRSGPFSLNAGATWTRSKITEDVLVPATAGNVPKHQPALIFQATPVLDLGPVTLGANITGTTGSHAADTNLLHMPGYVLVNSFVQIRATDRVTVSLNANNLFDKLAIIEVNEPSISTFGTGTARAVPGRTVSAALRFAF